jgi:hypothetical protein
VRSSEEREDGGVDRLGERVAERCRDDQREVVRVRARRDAVDRGDDGDEPEREDALEDEGGEEERRQSADTVAARLVGIACDVRLRDATESSASSGVCD